jgi:hypothetical protein
MLLTPTLALLSIIFNFCALLHVTNNRDDLSNRRWHALDRAIYALEGATVTVYENCLDIIAPPPLTSSPVYFSPLRRAEWIYRSSAVRIVDLVDGLNGVKTVSKVNPPPLLPPPPPKPMDPVAPASIPPSSPTLISPPRPATLEELLTYKPSTPLAAISSATRFLGLTGLSCLAYALVFAWLKVNNAKLITAAPLAEPAIESPPTASDTRVEALFNLQCTLSGTGGRFPIDKHGNFCSLVSGHGGGFTRIKIGTPP